MVQQSPISSLSQCEFPVSEVGTLILAGGESSRMGRDKGLVPWQGVPLLRRVYEVATQCTERVEVITPWPERYEEILPVGVGWILERQWGQGPLVAFWEGLCQVRSPWILLLGCDLPRLEVSILQQWIGQLPQVPAAMLAVVPRRGDRWEPLCGFYRQNITRDLSDFIDSGGRSFQQWLSSIPVQPLPVDQTVEKMLVNCNTPQDLE